MFRHTIQVFVVELVLGVDDREHLLVENAEKGVHRVRELHVSFAVVRLELSEEIHEDLSVLHIDHSVRLLEHFVELSFGFVHHFFEKFVKTFRPCVQGGGYPGDGVFHKFVQFHAAFRNHLLF